MHALSHAQGKRQGHVITSAARSSFAIQQLRSKKVLDDLALLDVSEYVALRDGAEACVASDALVLGDLVRLASGQQVPADAVVVAGEAGVNESLLTGEADEIQKRVGDKLMSGSLLSWVQAKLNGRRS